MRFVTGGWTSPWTYVRGRHCCAFGMYGTHMGISLVSTWLARHDFGLAQVWDTSGEGSLVMCTGLSGLKLMFPLAGLAYMCEPIHSPLIDRPSS